MKKTVISPANIMLPPYDPKNDLWPSYAVIACDQFTSEPEYWEQVRERVGNSLSTLNYILPEAYLGTELEKKQGSAVAENMKTASQKLREHENCLIYIERVLPDGRIRPGIIGKLDLEEYDFSPDSKSAVRATEETVVSRIPPRVAVRKAAEIELPHVMVFADDTEKALIRPLSERKDEMELLYDFQLMQGGGSIKGYKLSGEILIDVASAIERYECSRKNGLVYAMGDGNHSLASAKAHYENVKKELGDKAKECNARYALVEIVDLNDSSIEFEPIYRLLVNCDANDILEYIASRANDVETVGGVTVIYAGCEKEICVPKLHELTMGSLQMLIDDYLAENKGVVCDYIHGEDTLKKLAVREKSVGFLCKGVEKEELFAYVEKNGTLPRKTFSMGEAASKRYYIEARKIIE